MKNKKDELIINALKQHLKCDTRYDLPRPFIISFFGTPDAGKTTIITACDNFLRRLGFRVCKPQEGAEFVRHVPRTTPVYNIRTAMYAINIMIDQIHNHQFDFVLFDRCCFDGYFWMEYWFQKGKLTKEQKEHLQGTFLYPEWTDHVDISYFVTCDGNISTERDKELNFAEIFGDTTNPKTVSFLKKIGEKVFEELSPKFPQIKLFDTTELKKKDMVEKIALDILFNLDKKTLK